jgi:hypothetical protein
MSSTNFSQKFDQKLTSEPAIEALDASVHPGAAGRDENDFDTNIEAESYKTTESTRVVRFKVPNKGHPIIKLQISGDPGYHLDAG